MDLSIANQLQIIRNKISDIRKAMNGPNFVPESKKQNNNNYNQVKEQDSNKILCEKRQGQKSLKNKTVRMVKCPKCGCHFEYSNNISDLKVSKRDQPPSPKEYSSAKTSELKKKVDNILNNSDEPAINEDNKSDDKSYNTEESSKSIKSKISNSINAKDNSSIKVPENAEKLSDIIFEEESISSCYESKQKPSLLSEEEEIDENTIKNEENQTNI